MDGYESIHDAEKRRAAEKKAADERYDLEQAAEDAQRKADARERDALAARRALRAASEDFERNILDLRETVDLLEGRIERLTARQVEWACAGGPVLRAFVLMAGGLPLGVPTPPQVDLLAEAKALLAKMEVVEDAERARVARKIARAANPEESEG